MGLSRFVPVPYSMRFVAFDFFSLWYLSLNGFVVFRRFFIQWGLLHFLGLSHYGVCYKMWFVAYYMVCLSLIGFVAVLNSYLCREWSKHGISLERAAKT